MELAEYIVLAHSISQSKGFWDEKRNPGEIIALIHSELSEALEALRSGNPESDKLPGISQVEEELADAIIRIFDFAEGFNYDIELALKKKLEYNKSRAYKHGRLF